MVANIFHSLDKSSIPLTHSGKVSFNKCFIDQSHIYSVVIAINYYQIDTCGVNYIGQYNSIYCPWALRLIWIRGIVDINIYKSAMCRRWVDIRKNNANNIKYKSINYIGQISTIWRNIIHTIVLKSIWNIQLLQYRKKSFLKLLLYMHMHAVLYIHVVYWKSFWRINVSQICM